MIDEIYTVMLPQGKGVYDGGIVAGVATSKKHARNIMDVVATYFAKDFAKENKNNVSSSELQEPIYLRMVVPINDIEYLILYGDKKSKIIYDQNDPDNQTKKSTGIKLRKEGNIVIFMVSCFDVNTVDTRIPDGKKTVDVEKLQNIMTNGFPDIPTTYGFDATPTH